jgi:hypothetical protein
MRVHRVTHRHAGRVAIHDLHATSGSQFSFIINGLAPFARLGQCSLRCGDVRALIGDSGRSTRSRPAQVHAVPWVAYGSSGDPRAYELTLSHDPTQRQSFATDVTPAEWNQAALGLRADIQTRSSASRLKPGPDAQDGCPVIVLSNITCSHLETVGIAWFPDRHLPSSADIC